MLHSKYFPVRIGDQLVWFANFKDKLAGYATTLVLTTAQVTAAVADCAWLIYILEHWLPAGRAFEKSCTEASVMAQTGAGSAVQLLPTFTPPALTDGAAPVFPGALDRIFALVQDIKKSGKCTDAIAEDLRIVGTVATPPDLTIIGPKLTAKVSGGTVRLGWSYKGKRAWLSGCEIHVDRSDTRGSNLLTVATMTSYVDTQPFPATKTVWSYKAIFRANDVQVGQWSQTVSVAVGG